MTKSKWPWHLGTSRAGSGAIGSNVVCCPDNERLGTSTMWHNSAARHGIAVKIMDVVVLQSRDYDWRFNENSSTPIFADMVILHCTNEQRSSWGPGLFLLCDVIDGHHNWCYHRYCNSEVPQIEFYCHKNKQKCDHMHGTQDNHYCELVMVQAVAES